MVGGGVAKVGWPGWSDGVARVVRWFGKGGQDGVDWVCWGGPTGAFVLTFGGVRREICMKKKSGGPCEKIMR